MKRLRIRSSKTAAILSTALVSAAAIANFGGTTASAATTTLKFYFWGSNFEGQQQDNMASTFSKSHPGVNVQATLVNNADFQTKMNTLMAANTLPDMGYLDAAQALIWGQEGHIVNVGKYVKKYPALGTYMPQTYVRWSKTQYTVAPAPEIQLLYYNPELFKKANISPPPANVADAWSWNKFVKVAEELTLDRNGLHPYQKGFDVNHIVQYGINIPLTWEAGWFPYLVSNGGSITNPAGTKYTMNSPQAVRVFQNLHDLIWKYHVMPNPTASKNLPASNVLIATNQFAMVQDGQWSLLDFDQNHVNFGLGVLPNYIKPTTMMSSCAVVAYSTSKTTDLDMKYLEYETSPTNPLVLSGLWMPAQKAYYTNPKLVKKWTNNPAHPPEYKQAAVDYFVRSAVPDPEFKLKNFVQMSPIIEQDLSEIWLNQKPVKEVLDTIGKQIQPYLKGSWPN